MIKKIVGFSLFLLFLLSCRENTEDLSAYYFPFDELKEGKVYVFKSKDENIPIKDYWYYKSYTNEKGIRYLKAISLDRKGLPLQFVDYEIDSAEVRLISMYIVERDKRGHTAIIPVKIEQPYIYNIELRDTSKALYAKIIWNNPFDSLEYTLQKVRTFKGFQQMKMDSKVHSIIRFEIATEFLTFTPHDGETHSAWPEYEIYSKGMGLVEYKISPDPDFPIQMRLDKIYTKAEYQRLFHIHLDSLRPSLKGVQRR